VRSDCVLHRAHRQTLVDDASRELFLERPIGRAEQRARVPALERVLLDHLLDRGRQLQESQGVGDRDPAAADTRRHLLVRETEVLDELLVRSGFFERVEVGAVDVLDQCVLERRRVVSGSDQGRDRLQAGATGGAPTALARDQLVAVVRGTHEHGLEHADLPNGVGQSAELLLAEVLARLVPVGPDGRNWKFLVATGTEAFGRAGWDQGAEPLTQTAFSRHGTPLSPVPGTPWHPGRWNRTR
jgi:hypothetical protein